MKRILICVATVVFSSGGLQASGIISCSGVANSSNSCYTSHLSTFDLQLNWDTALSTSATSYVAPPIDSSYYDTTWYASAGYVNVAITGTTLLRADDFALVHTGLGWTSPPYWAPHYFSGNFDSAPDTGFTTPGVGLPLNSYGEGLLGSLDAGSFVIGANTVLTSFGFRIASITDTNFDVTINLFTSTDGSGTPAETLSLSDLNGGGNCASLSDATPLPCNTAPFVYVTTTGAIRSFSISTSDSTGFFIDAVDLNVAVPEPATLAITGGGLIALACFVRRKRAASTEQ